MSTRTGTIGSTFAAPGGLGSRLAREANAAFAIGWRELLTAVKSPMGLVFTVVFPVIFMGIMGGTIGQMGGTIGQNLGGSLPYAYLPFMLIGMLANTLYQTTITGVTNLVEERENDFTAELFVAPVSRSTVLLGKLVGAAVASLVSLVGVIAMIFVMQIPMDPVDLLRVLALAPVLALAGGSLGVLFIGFVQDPKIVGVGVVLLIFPQMFLAGALIPMSGSTGLLGLVAKFMPMTYSIDLARNIFYVGKPEYAFTVLHPAWLDLGVTVALFVAFTVIGTWLFVRADRNR